jgi:hypothetical protein
LDDELDDIFSQLTIDEKKDALKAVGKSTESSESAGSAAESR